MKDLCKTCNHLWMDFPLPLEIFVPHCEINDEKNGFGSIDDAIDYPCTKCPFDSYKPVKN